eukprot:262951-Chlamydomonas_euryale.AAC.3
MMNAASAIVAKDSNSQHVLAMFFRDDIVAWAARRSGKIGEGCAVQPRGEWGGRAQRCALSGA